MSSEWQPIETATAVGKKKLLFWTEMGRVVVGHRLAGTRVVISQDKVSYTATHWMPLPAPPARSEPSKAEALNARERT
jgi:hypothetical protein